ncbi:helix-turn-helix domain-containing protein [Rhodococcus sp. MALMAid1271]|uniref:helix-turn-helix domain-containing protein n=1 Tax=Rhodococcus sp. MALMAid1271 TaxID=3411744 RepID=UPI003BA321AF
MSTDAGFGGFPEFTAHDRLRKARERTGMDQTEFADHIGVSRGTVSNYESGSTTRLKGVVLKMWALATSVTVEWIETGNTESPRPENRTGTALPHLDSNQEPFD